MKFKILLVLVVSMLLTACSAGDGKESSGNTTENATTGDEAETYVVTFTGVTTDGDELTSEIFADSKLTMINVWATYCNPCLAEMPDLGEIAASYDKADFQMLGVVSDVTDTSEEEDIQYAKELIEQTKAYYPHMLLNESLYVNMVGAVEAVPTTFFINQKGEALGYVVGSRSKEAWEEIINELLAEEK